MGLFPMASKMNDILRGEIWWLDPDPIKGRELGKKIRPCIVLSDTDFNNGSSGLVIILPCTTTDRGIPCHVELSLQKDGVKSICFAMCEQIRAIDKLRLKKRIGKAGPESLRQMGNWVGDLLNLF